VGDAHHPIPHNDQKASPPGRFKMFQSIHDGLVEFQAVRLAQSNHQDAMMWRNPISGETFVSGDEDTLLAQSNSPDIGVSQSLTTRSSDIFDIMTELSQPDDGHQGDVLVNENSHV
jgi:hypothetical protein